MRSVCLTLGVRFWPGWDEIHVYVIEIVVAGHVDHDGRLETTVKPEEPDTATAVPEGPGANGVCLVRQAQAAGMGRQGGYIVSPPPVELAGAGRMACQTRRRASNEHGSHPMQEHEHIFRSVSVGETGLRWGRGLECGTRGEVCWEH